jgi:hypothetical protein
MKRVTRRMRFEAAIRHQLGMWWPLLAFLALTGSAVLALWNNPLLF